MSTYDKIDHLIVETIKSGSRTFLEIFRDAVQAEALRLHEEDRKLRAYAATQPFRFIDSRLQALRKRGLIVHVKGWGWRVKEAA